MLNRWTGILLERARLVVALAVVATIAAATYGLGVFPSLGQGGFDDPKTDASKELASEQDVFGNKTVDVIEPYRSKTRSADDPPFRQQVEKTLAGIPKGTSPSVVRAWDSGDPAMVSTD